MLINNVDYHELGADHLTRRNHDRIMHRISKQANSLGFTVRFDPVPASAATTCQHRFSIHFPTVTLG